MLADYVHLSMHKLKILISVKLKLNYFLDGSSVDIIVNVSLLSCFMFLSSFYYN